jgi:hypothetical protein
MKITIEHYDEEVSLSTKHDDITASQVAEIMQRMCQALGYHSQSIGEAFYEAGVNMIETYEH